MLLTPLLLALFFSFIPQTNANGTYYPSGPQQNVSKQTLIDGGWTLCWEDYYNSYSSLSNIWTSCTGNYLLYAGGLSGDSSYLLLAAGERSAMLTNTGQNQTTLNNGTYWYYSGGWGSIGFAPNSTINQNSADVHDAWSGDTGHLRLSWHSDGSNVFGGWRVGNIIGLNGSTQYQRAIWQTGVINQATPTPTPTPTSTPPTPGDYTINEGSSQTFQSPAGYKFESVTAWYGDPNDGLCGIDLSTQISQEINGIEGDVTIFSDNRFIDSCPGISKVLILSNFVYTLIPTPTPTPTPTPEPSPTQTQDPDPVQPDPDPTPVVTITDEPETQVTEEPQEEPEQILEPSPEPTPIQEIISVEEEVNNAIDELIVNDEEITDEQLNNIAELLLDNYEINEVMPVAELLDQLNVEQILELLEQLDPNQIIEYREGVTLEAGVAIVFEQLADPAALIGELFSDPSQTLEALGQLGADMTEEEREDSQDVIVAAVVATQVATMAMTMAPPSAPSAPAPSSPQGPNGPGSQPKNEFDAGSGGEARRKPKVKVKKKIKIKKPKVKIKRNNRRIK